MVFKNISFFDINKILAKIGGQSMFNRYALIPWQDLYSPAKVKSIGVFMKEVNKFNLIIPVYIFHVLWGKTVLKINKILSGRYFVLYFIFCFIIGQDFRYI